MSLEDFLKFEQVGSPLPGATAITQTSRPTKSGIKLLASPSNFVGLAFRVCNSTLEALSLSSEHGARVILTTSLGIPAVNVAASPDGRLVAVCLADGSLCCFDVVEDAFRLRWKIEGAHSHIELDLNQSVSKSRANAAGAAGPARSLQFSPTGYALALVDDGQQGLTIYHADDCGTPVESVQRQLAELNLACAAWSPSFDETTNECTIAVGTIEGNGAHVFNYNVMTSRLTPLGVLPYPGESDDGPAWSCTHIEWIPDGSALGCGYCRVLPPDEDVEEDEDDQDDAAQHQVCFYISSFPPGDLPAQSMGDVVPFFAPSKDGRHVFFTTTVPNNSKYNMMLVGSNVGSDVHILAGEDPSSWAEVELPEGDNASTPTDEHYEFTYPTGLVVANVEKDGMRTPMVLLLATDGSLTCFRLLYESNESFFQLPLIDGVGRLEASPLPKSSGSRSAPELFTEDTVPTPPVSDVTSNLFGESSKASFDLGSLSISASPQKSTSDNSEKITQKSAFGDSSLSHTANSEGAKAATSSLAFGLGQGTSQTSSFGSNTLSPPQPVFGETSSLLGPQSAPFGSGSNLPFGSGKSNLSFWSGDSKNVFGSSSFSNKPFSFETLASSPATGAFGQPVDPFNTFKKTSGSAFAFADMTKPLFDTSPEATKEEQKPKAKTSAETQPVSSTHEVKTPSQETKLDSMSHAEESTPEARKAAEVFDAFDIDKKGTLPVDKMEDLIEALGEGFYGDELTKQIQLIDKDDRGQLDRQAFIDWYVQLLNGDDDGASSGGSDGSDEREERERAEEKFEELCSEQDGVHSISESEFPRLIESLGTTYCDEEHRKTIKKLKDSDGRITKEAFVSWYIDWLFGGDESDIDDSEGEDDDSEEAAERQVDSSGPTTSTGWGDLFRAEEGTWKCDVCMVSNPGKETRCKACETIRPGTETAEAKGGDAAKQLSSDSAISSSGFSFGGALGAGGFSFAGGQPSPAVAPIAPSGFSFKSSGPSGFSFGSTPQDASGTPAQIAGPLEKEVAGSMTVSSASAFQPITSAAPTPFSASGDTAKSASSTSLVSPRSNTEPKPFSAASDTAKSASSSSAFPPMSNKAPTPFSAATTKSASSSSAFPPMSSTAPSPFAAANDTAKSASSPSAFPPVSNTAPSPFSAATTKSASSASAFPPMSNKSPTPFSSVSETAKSASSSSAFPPKSNKVPTPFSVESDTAKSALSSSAFPPMSSTAPSPFSAATTKSASSAPAFPPMSNKSPTPFSAVSDTAKSASSPSAFPPMSSTAPTPFSAATTKSASSASAFPPMSNKSPTPFSAVSDSAKSASSASAFPPMSNKAPTPFSAATTKSASSASAFPPMSNKSPTPFSAASDSAKSALSASAFPPMSNKAPTPFSAATTKSASSASAFPEMSNKSPTPFSAASDTSKSASSASAYPPMSNKAPTPFSTATTKSASSASAFPEMSNKSPTPFSAASDTSKSASSASAYPPMSKTAASPFSAATTKSASLASAFPPMSNKAPTPFSAASDTTKIASSSSAFPPMSSKAPTPFSAASHSAKSASSSSAFPPMSSMAPSPFSAASDTTKFASSASVFPTISSKAPAPFSGALETRRDAEPRSSKREANASDLSEISQQYAVIIHKMQDRLDTLSQMIPRNSGAEIKADIANIARSIQESLVTFSATQTSLSQQKQRSVKILSHKATASMRVIECEKYLGTLLSSENEPSSLLKLQPLDAESETRRREITSTAMMFNRSIDILKSRSQLLDDILEDDGDMRLLVSINETRKKIQGLREDLSRVESRLSSVVRNGPDIRTRAQSSQTTRVRTLQPDMRDSQSSAKWNEVESHLSTLARIPKRTVFDLTLPSRPQVGHKQSLDHRKPIHSRMTKPSDKQLSLFSPTFDPQPRAGWDEPSTLDQTKMKSLSFSTPSQLKNVTFDSAARSALSGFGTTPERVKESFSAHNRDELADANKRSLSSKPSSPRASSSSHQVESSVPSQSPSRSHDTKPSNLPSLSAPRSTSENPKPIPNDSTPKKSTPLPKDIPREETKEKGSGLASLQGLGTMLFSNTSASETGKSSMSSMQPSETEKSADFHKLLTEFYTKHNSAKLSEVPTVLSKYKGRENEMFAKLAKRYGVPNPLDLSEVNSSAAGITSGTGSLFQVKQASNNAPQLSSQQKPPLSQSPFGTTNKPTTTSPFGTQGLSSSASAPDTQPSFSGFGSSSAPSFASSMSSPSPFGGSGGLPTSPSPFTASSNTAPFGSASATQPPAAATFNGKNARELLTEFYQEKNPAKLHEVDRLLEKYRGNEEALFRNLAQKYKLDPSKFGLSSAPAPIPGTFGSTSPMGTGGLGGSTLFGGAPSTSFGSGGFGSASPLGQNSVFGSAPVSASAPSGGSVFGSGAGSTSFGASGFGSLAQSSPNQGFGSFGSPSPPTPFGATSPFGGPRR